MVRSRKAKPKCSRPGFQRSTHLCGEPVDGTSSRPRDTCRGIAADEIENARSHRSKLLTRYKKTYKARLEMEKRLAYHQTSVERLILGVSIISLALTMMNLRDPQSPSAGTPVMLAILASLTFAGSLILRAANLEERRSNAFNTYRKIQQIRIDIKRLDLTHCVCEWPKILEEKERLYEQLVSGSENHKEHDYYRSLVSDRKAGRIEAALSDKPTDPSKPELRRTDEKSDRHTPRGCPKKVIHRNVACEHHKRSNLIALRFKLIDFVRIYRFDILLSLAALLFLFCIVSK